MFFSLTEEASNIIVIKTGLFLKNKYKNINIKHWQIESDEMKLHKVFFFFFKPAAYHINTTCTFSGKFFNVQNRDIPLSFPPSLGHSPQKKCTDTLHMHLILFFARVSFQKLHVQSHHWNFTSKEIQSKCQRYISSGESSRF